MTPLLPPPPSLTKQRKRKDAWVLNNASNQINRAVFVLTAIVYKCFQWPPCHLTFFFFHTVQCWPPQTPLAHPTSCHKRNKEMFLFDRNTYNSPNVVHLVLQLSVSCTGCIQLAVNLYTSDPCGLQVHILPNELCHISIALEDQKTPKHLVHHIVPSNKTSCHCQTTFLAGLKAVLQLQGCNCCTDTFYKIVLMTEVPLNKKNSQMHVQFNTTTPFSHSSKIFNTVWDQWHPCITKLMFRLL